VNLQRIDSVSDASPDRRRRLGSTSLAAGLGPWSCRLVAAGQAERKQGLECTQALREVTGSADGAGKRVQPGGDGFAAELLDPLI
jgi:hypothetical protein